MSEVHKKKLSEQLIKCVLDDKLSTEVKLRKMDYIIRLGGDVNATHDTGYSLLSLAKLMGDEKIVQFLEKNGARETEFDKTKTTSFFRKASIEDINKFLKILPDGYELNCYVDLSKRDLTELPDFSKVIVKGFFDCSINQLTSLKGAPKKVTSFFNCNDNNLTSLVGGPREVGWNFDCSRNMLTNLKGVPLMIKRGFYCSHNELTSLEGIQTEIIGNFDCGHNKLTSLKGAPIMVGRDFNCKGNKLTSLEYAPKEVGRNFYCANNPLKSYDGKPDNIEGMFIGPDILPVGKVNGGVSR